MEWSGGCLCGAVRYLAGADPIRVVSCHCGTCRRFSGAAFMTFVHFPVGRVHLDRPRAAALPLLGRGGARLLSGLRQHARRCTRRFWAIGSRSASAASIARTSCGRTITSGPRASCPGWRWSTTGRVFRRSATPCPRVPRPATVAAEPAAAGGPAPRLRLAGGCHCGNLELVFETAQAPAGLTVRACGCSFCRRHGSRTVSDPGGRVEILVHDPAELSRYAFGLGTAEFLVCRRCGVYVGAVMAEADAAWAIVNVNALATPEVFAEAAVPVSYDRESETERRARRQRPLDPGTVTEAGGRSASAALSRSRRRAEAPYRCRWSACAGWRLRPAGCGCAPSPACARGRSATRSSRAPARASRPRTATST